MKKQTAVEWLEYQLKIYGTISDENTSPSLDTLFKMLEQAKAMEKEQIKKAYIMGWITREHKPIKTEVSNSAYADNYLKDMFSDL